MIVDELNKLLSVVPTSVLVDRRLIDFCTPQRMTVQTLLDEIVQALGIEQGRAFAALVLRNEIPEDVGLLVDFLFQRRAHAVAKTALEKLHRANECKTCGNDWHPKVDLKGRQ